MLYIFWIYFGYISKKIMIIKRHKLELDLGLELGVRARARVGR